MRSVLQDWVMELPLREQGVILTGARGCDVQPKLPLDATPRQLVGWLRWACFVPHDPREVGTPGAWFQDTLPVDWKPSEFGHLPLHYVAHLMHCFEVVGYRHPDEQTADAANRVYERIAHSLHLNVEIFAQMRGRLAEDRIAAGTVVS